MEIHAYDQNWDSIPTVIEGFDSLIWTERYQANGDFQLIMDVDPQTLDLLQKDYFLEIEDSDIHMIILDRELNETGNGDTVTITGKSLQNILSYRVVHGVESLNGNLQTELKRIVNENIISPTDSTRMIDDFIFVDSVDTDITSLTVDAQYFCKSLLDIFINLCTLNNIGFKVIRNHVEKRYELSLYKGVDRSIDQIQNPQVEFSPSFDNLSDGTWYEKSSEYSNTGIVAGEGEGVNRRIISTTLGGSYSGINRREIYIDGSGISKEEDGQTLTDPQYDQKLITKGKEDLEKVKIFEAYDGTVIPTDQYVFGIDFKMGDLVQIENKYGMTSTARITEWIISISGSGYTSYPTFEKIGG